MKVIDARINEMKGYANPPHLELLVDELPSLHDFIYRSKLLGEDRTAYLAEKDGEVRFMIHDPHNERGYAGSIFELLMEDETIRRVRGPWSSRAGAMRKIFGIELLDVVYTAKPGKWAEGRANIAGHVTLELAQEGMKFIDGWELQLTDSGNEQTWEPVKVR